MNASPQLAQKPDERAGRSPRARPTGLPHLAQYRFDSGTSATAITAVAGSAVRIGAISTRPPPKRRADAPVRELDDVRPLPRVRVDSALLLREEAAVPCRGVGAGAGVPATGASPHVSQYPSSIVPSQPARAHPPETGVAATGTGAAAGVAAGAAAGARPQVSQ
ncbi:hypothetical protein Aph02nite_04660 [Actinoplanes philippinensis]|nr:hypothetical protein Aph02nite_04660 [Actinoplanes philippinensis]